ncbi:ribosomal RNA small subunit methyltransferase A, partial [Candidatus Peribacteria bacterium]|nr:ribosomal RNA small subunit methyltransferase A [Candidatus Peribacteria bacterium]
GQHFLIDESVLEDIVTVADIKKTDSIVEIGPGIGILTRELLSRAGHVTAIEIDPRMIPLLRIFTMNENAELSKNLTIVEGNALQAAMPSEAYKVVANIPYHITSPLLTHLLLESPKRPTAMTLLIQREVAENICSQESDSMLTVLVRLFGTPSLVRLVPPHCFLPPPKVDSAVLHIECFAEPKADLETVKRILKLSKLAFSKRRKMLRNTIGETPGGTEAMQEASIDPMRRPQTLSTDEWIMLDKALMAIRSA